MKRKPYNKDKALAKFVSSLYEGCEKYMPDEEFHDKFSFAKHVMSGIIDGNAIDGDSIKIETEFHFAEFRDEQRYFMVAEYVECMLFGGNSLTGISRNEIHRHVHFVWDESDKKEEYGTLRLIWGIDLKSVCLGWED